MSLCSLCLSIPFESLPPPPPEKTNALGLREEIIMLSKSNQSPFEDPIGFPYHESFDALEASALSCSLCALVQGEVTSWFVRYNHAATHNLKFIEYTKSRVPPPDTTQPLWLTQRFSKGPGFLVLVRCPTRNSGIYVMAGVGFNAGAELTRRRFDTDSGSLNSLEVASSWLKDCVENHDSCSEGSALLPTRVLDIGASGNNIKLIESAGLSGKYACVSYCWGSSKQFTTTRESIEERKRGFDIQHLPKTIHDAVTIARYLAIHYLWVDSLCICQGDVEDWSRESGLMTEVYSNAHIVIAVNHAQDSSIGCFSMRTLRSRCSVDLDGDASCSVAMTLYLHDEAAISYGEFQDDALSQRGWALQERVLARRVLHYNARQMYFECNRGIVGEDGCSIKGRYCGIQATDMSSWDDLVFVYLQRLLTKTTDALPAMSGLAKVFGKGLNAQYVAGLWTTDLISGLSWDWSRSTEKAAIEYIGPSWSWASCEDIATSVHCFRGKDIAEAVEWNVEHKTETNPYGEIVSAWLRVRSPIISLVPSKTGRPELDARRGRAGLPPEPRMCTIYSEEVERGRIVTFDNDHVATSGMWQEWDLEMMILRYIKREKDLDSMRNAFDSFFGLVVRRIGDDRQRVGWMFVLGDEGRKAIEDENNWATVKLI